MFTICNGALSLLSHMVLNINHVGTIFDVLNPNFACKDRRSQFLGRRKTSQTRQASLLLFTIALRSLSFHVHKRGVEALMTYIVDRIPPCESISPAAF